MTPGKDRSGRWHPFGQSLHAAPIPPAFRCLDPNFLPPPKLPAADQLEHPPTETMLQQQQPQQYRDFLALQKNNFSAHRASKRASNKQNLRPAAPATTDCSPPLPELTVPLGEEDDLFDFNEQNALSFVRACQELLASSPSSEASAADMMTTPLNGYHHEFCPVKQQKEPQQSKPPKEASHFSPPKQQYQQQPKGNAGFKAVPSKRSPPPTPSSRSPSSSSSAIASTKKKEPMERCRESLIEKLKKLQRMQILRHSFSPFDACSNFEILEFYGDSVLYERISFFIMQTRRFMSPHLLTRLRCSVINNKNLARCFDSLDLHLLLLRDGMPSYMTLSGSSSFSESDSSSGENGGGFFLPLKTKADVIEAVIGELAEAIANPSKYADQQYLIQAVLDEFLAYISYMGEQYYFSLENAKESERAPSSSSSSQLPQQQPQNGAKSQPMPATPKNGSSNSSRHGKRSPPAASMPSALPTPQHHTTTSTTSFVQKQRSSSFTHHHQLPDGGNNDSRNSTSQPQRLDAVSQQQPRPVRKLFLFKDGAGSQGLTTPPPVSSSSSSPPFSPSHFVSSYSATNGLSDLLASASLVSSPSSSLLPSLSSSSEPSPSSSSERYSSPSFASSFLDPEETFAHARTTALFAGRNISEFEQ
ncbi:hypothetical protein QOT17_004748 [Balamuthia mandrillaris]